MEEFPFQLIIIGTNWGRIHVLDHQGNKVKEFASHNNPVTMIDMDNNGDYIASCSHDRRVSKFISGRLKNVIYLICKSLNIYNSIQFRFFMAPCN